MSHIDPAAVTAPVTHSIDITAVFEHGAAPVTQPTSDTEPKEKQS